MEKKKSGWRIALGVICILAAAASIRGYVWYAAVIYAVGYLMIAIAMFASVPTLAAVGSAFLAALSLYGMVRNVLTMIRYHGTTDLWIGLISSCVSVILGILMFVACIRRDRASKIMIPAVVISAADMIWRIISLHRAGGYFLPFFFARDAYAGGEAWFLTKVNLRGYLLPVVIYLLLGFALETMAEKARKSSSAPLPTKSYDSPAERLTKLKALLDSGIVTQEEFDAKKAEILK